jgi:hypothetical protein
LLATTLLLVALLLLLRAVRFRLSLAIVLATHVGIVIATVLVGPRRFILLLGFTILSSFIVVFPLLILRLIGFILIAVLRVTRSGRDQEQK